ncbi:IS3 family transposase [Flammeovirgaceae bacterium SG7u.111]|nr:IS3 family transposase [Flammeovirgaceae bacterium SG7u.132]WPO37822.1 IS3 family transposase [Flammeovirgaceae bacterium SG7u.111]
MCQEAKLRGISRSENLSLVRQCQLLGINRGRLYYQPVPESGMNLRIMRLMGEHYLVRPDKGPRRMRTWLKRVHGINANLKKVSRLYYEVMGLSSILSGSHTSKPAPGNKVCPYLLRGMEIERTNQAWQTDITYIGLSGGYLYLAAWIDVATRFVLDWSLSNTMTAGWCAEVFERACSSWGKPEIVNTDQGSQYTSDVFASAVLEVGKTKLSMDGKGRATDNAFIERLWRIVKYEYVFLHDFANGTQLAEGLKNYFYYYNHEREHPSIEPPIPSMNYLIN